MSWRVAGGGVMPGDSGQSSRNIVAAAAASSFAFFFSFFFFFCRLRMEVGRFGPH